MDEAYLHDFNELYNKVKGKASDKQPDIVTKQHTTTSTVYERDPDIAAFAKRRAKGKCDLCGSEAPFLDNNGYPYLEAHHIQWLSKGGPDEIDNVTALCPNCHRKMHIVADISDVNKLIQTIEQYNKNHR